jgi:hypothetical protein
MTHRISAIRLALRKSMANEAPPKLGSNLFVLLDLEQKDRPQKINWVLRKFEKDGKEYFRVVWAPIGLEFPANIFAETYIKPITTEKFAEIANDGQEAEVFWKE